MNWFARPSPAVSRSKRVWMMRPGALTKGLRSLGRVELKIIKQNIGVIRAEEAHLLKLPRRSLVWTRQISMSIDGEQCVVARSVARLRDTHSIWRGVRGLNTRPLADILYHDTSIDRSNFDVSRVRRPEPLHSIAKTALQSKRPTAFYARRSIFWRMGKPLLVSECFLPAFWRLLEHHNSQSPGNTERF